MCRRQGNASNCASSHPACQTGPLPCTGKDTFAKLPGLKLSTKVSESGWEARVRIPFSLFSYSFPVNAETSSAQDCKRPWPLWRANFYRYAYPHGVAGDAELSGWSPVYNPSFHTPDRFGVLRLVDH